MNFKILTIDEYITKNQLMKNDEWFNSCFNPQNDSGLIEKGILQFPEDEWAIGGGFEGNCSIYTIRDFREHKITKGRTKVVTDDGYDFIDSPDMNDLVPFDLLSIKTLVKNEIKGNYTSVFTYPRRFTNKYAQELKVVIGGTVCQECNFPIKLIPDIEKELTEIEWKYVLIKRNQLRWSITSVSQEQPISIRISGIDDGAVEGLFENIDDAKRKLHEASFMGFKDPFFHTD